MKKVLMGALAMGALTVGALGQVSSAEAATFDCPINISGLVLGASQCEYSNTITNPVLNDNATVVNDEGFFDADLTNPSTLWLGGERILEIPKGQPGQSGEWSISSTLWNTYDEIMLIFKDGNDTSLVGYLLNQGISSGTWSSPFQNPPFTGLKSNQVKDVSHISVYYRGQSTPIPTPALLPGLIGLGFAAMRKKKQAAEVAQEA